MLLATRRNAEARQLAYACSAECPGDPAPLLVAARAELALGEAEQASKTAGNAVGLDPGRAASHRVLAVIGVSRAMQASDIRRRELAVRALESAHEALRLGPGDLGALLVAAEAAAWAGRFADAVRDVDDAVRRAPDNAQVWLVRARVARLAGDLEVADAAARQALLLHPESYAANNELGIILRARGRERLARRQFATAAAIDPMARPARANLVGRGSRLVWLGCLAVTLAPALLLVGLAPRASSVGSLAFLVTWFLGAAALHSALMRFRPLSDRLQRRAVANARKAEAPSRRLLYDGTAKVARAHGFSWVRKLYGAQGSAVALAAGPIRRHYALRTSLLAVLNMVAGPLAIGLTLFAIVGPAPQGGGPGVLITALVWDLFTLASLVALVRRLKHQRSAPFGHPPRPHPAGDA